jgi:hypothetical protein
MVYYHHPKYLEELDEFIRKHTSSGYSAEKVMEDVQRIMDRHFEVCPAFTNNQINLASGFDGYGVYFFKELIIPDSGIRRSQYPKCYLLKIDNKIGFLCLDSHTENYKDSMLRKLALARAEELFPILTKM